MATTAVAPRPSFKDELFGRREELEKMLPKGIRVDHFLQAAYTAWTTVPDLRKCEPASIWKCLNDCASLGLEPNGPLKHAALIPRWFSKLGKHLCTLQIPYQGMIELAGRAGSFRSLYTEVNRKGDVFLVYRGTKPGIGMPERRG